MNRFTELKETYEGCEYIGDFFDQKIIKLTYARLWNSEYPEEKICSSDFNIFKKDHLDFIRKVFENEELSSSFLLKLKGNCKRLKNIQQFTYEIKQIISFALIWVSVQERITTYSESLTSLFSEKAISTLEHSSHIVEFEDEDDDIRITRYNGFHFLLNKKIIPISNNGRIILGVNDLGIDGITEVVDLDGKNEMINDDGKILNEIDIRDITLKQVQKRKELYEGCLTYIQDSNKYDCFPAKFSGLFEELKLSPGNENSEPQIKKSIKKLKEMIESCNYIIEKTDSFELTASNGTLLIDTDGPVTLH